MQLAAEKSCRLHACTSEMGQLGCRVRLAAENAHICLAEAPQGPVGPAKLAQLQYEVVPLENSGMDCRADIADLEPGLDYLLRVSAVNAQGPSPASEPGLVPSHLARPTGCVLQHTATASPVCCSTAAEGRSRKAICWWICG